MVLFCPFVEAGTHSCLNFGRKPGLHLFSTLEIGFDAAVFLFSFSCLVVGRRSGWAVAFCNDPLGSNAERFDEIVADAVGAALREFHVARLGADAVGMPFNGTLGCGEFLEE